MQSSKEGMWKGYHLSIEGIQKGYLFVKNGIWKVKGLDLGPEPPLAMPIFHLAMPILQILWPLCPSVKRCRNANCGQWCVFLPQTILKQLKEWHVIVSCDQLGVTWEAAPTPTPAVGINRVSVLKFDCKRKLFLSRIGIPTLSSLLLLLKALLPPIHSLPLVKSFVF